MEGFLFILNKKKYTRYWCVLEGQQLTQYADFDVTKQQEIGLKGVLHVKNAEIQKCAHMKNEFSLSILCEGKKSPVYIDCFKEGYQNDWYTALMRAASYHTVKESREVKMRKYADILGLSNDTETLTPKLVTSTYRKLCLKAHPDKGGDMENFNVIRQAYTKLSEYVAENDARANCPEIEYEAVIKKVPKHGLGIIVVENLVMNRIVVQSVQSSIVLEGISEEADGEIRPGDTIYAIGKDVCYNWPMSRLKARLNQFRVPDNSSIRISFARRLPKETSEEPLSPTNSFKSPLESGAETEETSPFDLQLSSQGGLSDDLDKRPGKDYLSEKKESNINDIDSCSESHSVQTHEFNKNDVKNEDIIEGTPHVASVNSPIITGSTIDTPDDTMLTPSQDIPAENINNDMYSQPLPLPSRDIKNGSSCSVEAVENSDNKLGVEDFQRNLPVTEPNERDFMLGSDLEEIIRELQKAKSDLKESSAREHRLRLKNDRLEVELSNARAEIRVLQQEARTSSEDLSKSKDELDELKERNNALTTLLEERVAELKKDDSAGSTSSTLENLVKNSNSAISYKRETDIAYNNLAKIKLILQDKSVNRDNSSETNKDSNNIEAMTAKLRKQLLSALDM